MEAKKNVRCTLTVLVIGSALSPEVDGLVQFVSASACDIYVGTFGEANLQCDDGHATTNSRNENVVTWGNARMHDRSPVEKEKKAG